jgi:hypothetical protein
MEAPGTCEARTTVEKPVLSRTDYRTVTPKGNAMSVKHILLPLTGEASSADAAICGMALAKQLQAHVTVGYEDELGPFYIVPDFGASAASYGLFYEQMQKVRSDRKAQARAYFDQAVGTTKLPIVSAPTCKQGSTMWIDDEGGHEFWMPPAIDVARRLGMSSRQRSLAPTGQPLSCRPAARPSISPAP